MQKLFLVYIIFLGIGLILYGCRCRDQSEKKDNQPTQIVQAPHFNADSAYTFIKKQVDFGPRVPGTKAHELACTYLVKTFKRYTRYVNVQDFQTTTFDGILRRGKNIIVAFHPSRKKRILLNAHWDSRPFADQDTYDVDKPIDGANDGASGVGLLMEMARIFSIYDTFKVGIDIILFDIEDYGIPKYQEQDRTKTYYCLGSQYWIKNLHSPNYKANYGILIDMVAFKNSVFVKEGVSRQYGEEILEKIWKMAYHLRYHDLFISKSVDNTIIHDHYFINQIGIPTVAIMGANPIYLEDKFFIDVWHKHTDNFENIDKNTLRRVGQLLLTLVYNENYRHLE